MNNLNRKCFWNLKKQKNEFPYLWKIPVAVWFINLDFRQLLKVMTTPRIYSFAGYLEAFRWTISKLFEFFSFTTTPQHSLMKFECKSETNFQKFCEVAWSDHTFDIDTAKNSIFDWTFNVGGTVGKVLEEASKNCFSQRSQRMIKCERLSGKILQTWSKVVVYEFCCDFHGIISNHWLLRTRIFNDFS